MSEATEFPPHHVVHHEAMKTTYALRLCGEDEALLRSLACECINRIDELEQKLSRFFEGGDVFRINNLQKGETLHVSEECHECLLQALEAHVHTGGLFDPTLGSMIEHRKSGSEGDAPPPSGQLSIDPDTASVTCLEPGRIVDLGGIGKGFTLDQLALYLHEYGLDGALLSAGASTHLAFGKHSWPIDLSGERDTQRVALQNESISASGSTIQGSHIVSTEDDRDSAPNAPARIWARSPSAAFSDAWSTALMLMTEEEQKAAPNPEAKLTAVHIEQRGNIQYFEAQ